MDVSKLTNLEKLLAGLDSAVVALSGGVDSSLLLAVAARIIVGPVVAVTARSVLNPPGEMEMAQTVARQVGRPHRIIETTPLDLTAVRNNTRDRCYHCKAALMARLTALAQESGLTQVLDGGNADDRGRHRPGHRALVEFGVRSPLAEVGFTKAEIRLAARDLGLPNADRPAQACLATRFPYETILTAEDLGQVGAAEVLLTSLGFSGARARKHDRWVRVELPGYLMPLMVEDQIRQRAVAGLTGLGFEFVTLDLAGYRSGVFDDQAVSVVGKTGHD